MQPGLQLASSLRRQGRAPGPRWASLQPEPQPEAQRVLLQPEPQGQVLPQERALPQGQVLPQERALPRAQVLQPVLLLP